MKLCIPAKVLDQHLVVLGKTGAGKSSALRHLVEHLLEQKKRVVVVDPKGDWWGLKASADGKGAGFPVIAFGDFKNEEATDVPLNEHSGAHVAELIATGNRPAIIGFRGWMTGPMVRFWIDFAATLFSRNQGELYVVIDECHNFAPKGKIMDPQAGKCLHWTNRLMSEGRGLGIVCLIASQRPQKVHNDTLTSCETLVAMRVVHAADRGAVEEWIKGAGDKAEGQTVLSKLAQMSRGEAFVWSPEAGFGPERVQFPLFTTFDSFAPPQTQKKVSAKGWADVDLAAVTEKLASVIEEAKAKDPAELRRKIVELQRRAETAEKERDGYRAELQKAEFAAMALKEQAADLKTGKGRPVLAEGHLARIEKISTKLGEAVLMMDAGRKDLAEALEKVSEGQARARTGAAVGLDLPEGSNVKPNTPDVFSKATRAGSPHGAAPAGPKSPATRDRAAAGDGGVTVPQQRILDALATLHRLGLGGPDKSNVAVFSDQSPTSSGYANNLGRLRSLGLITYPSGGRLALTDAGYVVARPAVVITAVTDLHRAWFSKLAAPKVRILEQLIRVYPEALAKGALADLAGQSATSSGYANNLGNLRSLGLIDYPQSGYVAATELLFPPGL